MNGKLGVPAQKHVVSAVNSGRGLASRRHLMGATIAQENPHQRRIAILILVQVKRKLTDCSKVV